jgi:hypothetical protein
MSIYTTPLSQLGPADLQELIDGAAVENVRLEFKLLVPAKDETLKKLSSFANTFGGFMVVGAKASSSDGRIEDLPGVDEEPNYKQKVVQWCFDGASPPLTVEVSDPIPTPSDNGKFCYVISVAESEVAPHFLNGRKGLWIRTDEFSAHFEAQLANENELRHLLDRRKLVRERRAYLVARSRQRFATHGAKTIAGTQPDPRALRPCLEFCVGPRFPARPLCEQEKLKPYVQSSWMPWRQIMFTDPGATILSQHESAIVLNPTKRLSIFEANIWGMIFYATKVYEDHNGTSGIHLGQFVGSLLLFIEHSAKLQRLFGYSGPIDVELAVDSLLTVKWLDPRQGWFIERPGSELDDEIGFTIFTTSDEFRDKPDGIVRELLRNTFFAVNWAALVDTPQQIESLIRSGYTFNFWNQPTTLRF